MDDAPDRLLHILRKAVQSKASTDQPNLTLRQMAVLLTLYETSEPQTVSGLAQHLNISRPAVTRALDQLGDFDLAQRVVDHLDWRRINVVRTLTGTAMVRRLAEAAATATASKPNTLEVAESPSLPPKSANGNTRRRAQLMAKIVRLQQQLATAQAALLQVEEGSADASFAYRLDQLKEGQQIGLRGAREAAAARSRVEGDLGRLKDAAKKVPGPTGWLIRRARRRLGQG